MSASGPKQTFVCASRISARGGKADITIGVDTFEDLALLLVSASGKKKPASTRTTKLEAAK
jgi:hypothetical protein